MEIELRAKISNAESFESSLSNLPGLKSKGEATRQIDVYLKNESDKERRMVFRIRKSYDKKDGIFTIKTKSSGAHGDIAWHDVDMPVDDTEYLETLLASNGHVYVCIIDKVRESFQYGDIEINVDNIRDLGLFVELEKRGDDKEVYKIKEDLLLVLERLGMQKNQIIEKGYVPLMIEHAENER